MSSSKLTPQLHSEIVKRLRAGGYLDSIAREVGVTQRQVRSWINKGQYEQDKRDQGHHPDKARDAYAFFYMDASAAMAEAEGRAVVKIVASEDWRAHAWYLERKFPKQWGKQLNLHLEQEYDVMLTKLEKLLDPDTYETMLVAMATPDDLITDDEPETPDGG